MSKFSPESTLPRRTFLLTCMLPMLATIAGCKRPQELLKVSRHAWPGYMLLDLARIQGWLPEDQFRLVNLGSAKGTLRALSGHSIDVACLTLDEVLMAHAHGQMLQIIGVIDQSHGGDAVIARKGLTLNNLKGIKLGYAPDSVGQVVLNQLLKAASLKETDLEIIEVSSDEHISRFNELDALITFEPMASKLLTDPEVQKIYSSREFPGLIVDVFAATPHAVKEQPAALQNLLSAHYRAQQLIQSGEPQYREQLAQILKVSTSQLETLLQGLTLNDRASSLTWLSGPDAPLQKSMQQLNQILSIKPSTNQNNPGKLINAQFMQALT